MKPRELASCVARIEGHKSQARMGDVTEIIGIISDLAYKNPEVIPCIIDLGIARDKRKKANAKRTK